MKSWYVPAAEDRAYGLRFEKLHEAFDYATIWLGDGRESSIHEYEGDAPTGFVLKVRAEGGVRLEEDR